MCLHCRRETRLAARSRRRKLFARAFAITTVGAASVGGVTYGAIAITGWHPPELAALQPMLQAAVRVPAAKRRSHTQVSTGTSAPTPVVPVAAILPAETVPAAPRLVAPPPIAPVIGPGPTPLGDAMVAVRTGDSVVVRFDTPTARTRRAEKFESTVRSTLPRVYGAIAESALARVPSGSLAAGADLLSDLPAKGIHLTLSGTPAAEWAITLWPVTRAGQDGPLVVAYKAMVTRND